MNREIVFRFWNGHTMFYKDLFDDMKDISYIDAPMQYSGMKDKNGLRIFEGDIVRFVKPSTYPEFYEQSLPIYFESTRGFHPHLKGIGMYDDWMWWMSEVVGNIYENPELIPLAP